MCSECEELTDEHQKALEQMHEAAERFNGHNGPEDQVERLWMAFSEATRRARLVMVKLREHWARNHSEERDIGANGFSEF